MRIKSIAGALLFSLALHLFPSPATPAGVTVKNVTLDTFHGIIMAPSSVTMVVAMAAWCKPCRDELPTLETLHRQYRPSGLTMIGLSLDANGPKKLQPLIDKHNVSFPVYWVKGGAAGKYQIYGIPMILLIKNGEIVDRIPGQRSEKFLEKKIEGLLELD